MISATRFSYPPPSLVEAGALAGSAQTRISHAAWPAAKAIVDTRSKIGTSRVTSGFVRVSAISVALLSRTTPPRHRSPRPSQTMWGGAENAPPHTSVGQDL